MMIVKIVIIAIIITIIVIKIITRIKKTRSVLFMNGKQQYLVHDRQKPKASVSQPEEI